MKKSIKLTETDLENIILRILKEQTGPGITSFGLDNSRENARVSKQNENISLEKKYPCIPEDVRPFAEYVVQNKQKLMSELGVDANTLLFMAKAAIGIIGRETLFRTYSEWSDDAAEFLHSIGFGFLPKSAVGGLNLVNKISGKPVLLYTSFNSHNEPIIDSPNQAFDTLEKGIVDKLVIGNYVYYR